MGEVVFPYSPCNSVYILPLLTEYPFSMAQTKAIITQKEGVEGRLITKSGDEDVEAY